MQRHIPLEGSPNFRDLGGYEANCGRKLRYGKLFRSGVLARLTDEDVQRLQALNLTTICDFRRHEELERDPSRLPDAPAPRVVHLPIDPGSRTSFFDHLGETGDLSAADREIDMAQFMVDINRAFALEHHAEFKVMLDEIVELPQDGALLFHCAAGKDRTGFAAALIMMCLGVPRAQIEADYMLTAEYFYPDLELERLARKYADYGFQRIDPSVIRPMLEVRPEYIREAFNAIDEHFSSTDDYLQQVYSMGAPERNAMRDTLLS